MKNIEFYLPEIDDFWYQEKIQKDEKTMSYNAGYDVSYYGYDYDTGCINFPKEKWEETYNRRIKEKVFFAYIKDNDINEYIGYVSYYYKTKDDRYYCSVVIESKYSGKGYSKQVLKMLLKEAKKNNIKELYDMFEVDRDNNTLEIFKSVGFEIVEYKTWKKFNEDVEGVVIKCNISDHLV